MRRRPVAFHQARTEEPVVAARGTRVWGRLLRSMFVVCALVLLSSALILCRSALHRDLSVVRHYHPPGVQPVQDGSHLRVMAYNIAHGRGSRSFSGRGELHRVFSHSSRQDVLDSLRQVAAVIREADAGVVALNKGDVHNTSSLTSTSWRSCAASYRERTPTPPTTPNGCSACLSISTTQAIPS